MEDNRNFIESTDPDLNHYTDNIVNFNTYTPEAFRGNIGNKGSLNILHQNVRSILKEGRKDEIDIMLNTIDNPFHILAFTETWLRPDNVGAVKFNDYKHVYFFIENNIQFKVRDDFLLMLPYIKHYLLELHIKRKHS